MQSPANAPLLREPSFVCLWLIGGTVGSVRWLEVLAVSLYTLRETQSALAVSLMVFARILPPLLLGAFVGALADRVDRKRLYLGGVVLQVVVAATLAMLAAAGQIALWHIAVGALLSGAFTTMEHTVRRPLLGDAAGPARIGRALTLDSAAFSATRMVGPLAGGVMFEAVGLAGAYLLSALLLVLAAVLLAGVPSQPAERPNVSAAQRRGLADGLREGIRFARADRLVAGVLAATVILNFFAFSYVSLVPVVSERVLGLNAAQVGVLMSMEGLGALVSALLLATRIQRSHFARVFSGGSVLVLVAVLAFSLSRSSALSHVLLLTAGIGLAGFSATQSAILLVAAPAQARSRIMGLLVVCIGAQPLGVLHAGLLADWLGAHTAMTVMSVEGMLAFAVALRWLPELRWRRQFAPKIQDNSGGEPP